MTSYGFSEDGKLVLSQNMTYCMNTGKRVWNGLCESIIYSPNREYCVDQAKQLFDQFVVYHIASKFPCYRDSGRCYFLTDSHILVITRIPYPLLKIVNIFTREEQILSSDNQCSSLSGNLIRITDSPQLITIDRNTFKKQLYEKIPVQGILTHSDTRILSSNSIHTNNPSVNLLDYDGNLIGSHICEKFVSMWMFRLSPVSNCIAYLWFDNENWSSSEPINLKRELRIYDFDTRTLTRFELNFVVLTTFNESIHTCFTWNSDGESLCIFTAHNKVQQITKYGKIIRELNLVYEPTIVPNSDRVLENRIKYLETLIHSHVIGPITDYEF